MTVHFDEASAAPNVLDLLAAGASGPGRMRFEPSGIERSAAQIWQDSEQVARWLLREAGTGVRIGAFLTNTPDCPALVFGIWRSGNTLVSLPYPGRGADLETYVAQVGRMCDLADVRILMVDPAYRGLLPAMPRPVAGFDEAAQGAGGDAGRGNGSGARRWDELPPAAGDLIQFTSGSLGRPKGVVLTGQALAANILAILEASEGRPGDCAVTWLPMSHDMGFVGMFLTCFAGMAPSTGGELIVLQTPESFLADPASWLRLCSRYRATITTAPNFAFDLACRSAPFLTDIDLSALRICITGAERVRAQTLHRFTETFAASGLRPEAICPAYGLAEAALAVTLVGPHRQWRELSLDRAALGQGQVLPATGPDSAVSYVSNGPAVPGLEVRIVPPAAGPSAGPSTEVGEVQIRGTSLFRDYLGADRPMTPDGWFPTRDAGFLQDGELFLVGRNDETIIVGGQNHYAGDIEHAVVHDLIRPGNLAAVPLDNGFALLAEPVGRPEQDVLDAACRELAVLSARHAGLRPAVVGFLPRGSLKKTPSGKLQRLAMASALTAGQLTLLSSARFDSGQRQG